KKPKKEGETERSNKKKKRYCSWRENFKKQYPLLQQSKERKSSVSSFIQTDSDDKVIEAETRSACFLIKHNVPLGASDHATMLFCHNKIAQKYASKRSKTTAIIYHALAPEFTQETITASRSGPFTLRLDTSSDTEDKLFLILIRHCHAQTGEIKVALLDLPVCNIGTAESLLECVNVFKCFQIPWQNVVALLCDSTSVNVGQHNSLKTLIEKVSSADLFTLGCTCHLISLCASKAASALSIAVGDVLIRVFYYLDKSAKRKHLLKEYADFVGIEYRKILKRAPTRWLSLG
uniref:DUF4371 domain-containing protein n=1 Tax=Latimeria chalumnae TaxID=7897 RepID=H3ABT5_LATCH